jgi:hypothetical protein
VERTEPRRDPDRALESFWTGARCDRQEPLMTPTATELHRYRVHPRDLDGSAVRVLEETSFEAAAVAYAEDFGYVTDQAHELKLIVQDLDTGHQHCFLIDLETGETGPCN